MASSMWLKASRAGLIRPLCSRSQVSVRHGLTFLHQSRTNSTAAAFQNPTELDSGSMATPMDTPPASKGRKFQTLEGAVSKETLDAITVRPFRLTHMTAVQEEVLGLLPEIAEPYDKEKQAQPGASSRDLLVRAKTGTGKTLAFLVPAIEARVKAIQAAGEQAVRDAGLVSDRELQKKSERRYARETVGTLILSPTRELATQIANEALRLSHHHEGFEVRLFTGGTSKVKQIRDWMKGRRDIVVATTGRLRDVLSTEPDVVKGIAQTKIVGYLRL